MSKHDRAEDLLERFLALAVVGMLAEVFALVWIGV